MCVNTILSRYYVAKKILFPTISFHAGLICAVSVIVIVFTIVANFSDRIIGSE